jgi:hypothetical protein
MEGRSSIAVVGRTQANRFRGAIPKVSKPDDPDDSAPAQESKGQDPTVSAPAQERVGQPRPFDRRESGRGVRQSGEDQGIEVRAGTPGGQSWLTHPSFLRLATLGDGHPDTALPGGVPFQKEEEAQPHLTGRHGASPPVPPGGVGGSARSEHLH